MRFAPTHNSFVPISFQKLEARMGVAPMHNSFADCRLATWLPGQWPQAFEKKSRILELSIKSKILERSEQTTALLLVLASLDLAKRELPRSIH